MYMIIQDLKWTGNKIGSFKISPTSCFKFSANEVDWAHNLKGIFRTAHWNFLWGGSRNLYVVYFSLYARLNSIFEKKAPNLNVDVGEILNGPFLFPVHFRPWLAPGGFVSKFVRYEWKSLFNTWHILHCCTFKPWFT